jgi:hypothetical protein
VVRGDQMAVVADAQGAIVNWQRRAEMATLHHDSECRFRTYCTYFVM